jgi:hypothetical protein
MIELMLNLGKRDNYAFFDPESRLHLTAASPVGTVPQVTAAIQRGIDTNVLIRMDNVAKQAPVAESAPAAPVTEPVAQTTESVAEKDEEPVSESEDPVSMDDLVTPEAESEDEEAKKAKKTRGKKTM